MKTFTPRQLVARYTVAFALGTLTTWGVIHVRGFVVTTLTRWDLEAPVRHIYINLVPTDLEKRPSFDEAIRLAAIEAPMDTTVWHPLAGREKTQTSAEPIAYCEKSLNGNYLVIRATGAGDWIPSHELHALLDRRDTPATPATKTAP
jgi:hypothetical protein